MKNFIPLARPDIRDEDIKCAVEVLQSGMLVQGKNVELAESKLSKLLNSENAALLSNGTATLHAALISLGIGKGDEVIVPAFSYVATANVVELVGATCVFCDIDISTFNIDASKIEKLITAKTKAIIPVHEFGLSCEIETIVQIAKENSLFVIEDAACALGATYSGKQVGTFGDFGSFSFHPRKAISSGEGGLLVSNNRQNIDKIKILRNHGIEMQNGRMEFVNAGLNYRMTDFQAALLNSQLNRFDTILKRKQEISEIYCSHIKNKNLILPHVPNNCTHTWQTFHLLVSEKNRDEVIQQLKNVNIGTNYGAQCIPEMKYYLNKYNQDCAQQFPNAKRAYENGIAIPLYELLNEVEIQYIIEQINLI